MNRKCIKLAVLALGGAVCQAAGLHDLGVPRRGAEVEQQQRDHALRERELSRRAPGARRSTRRSTRTNQNPSPFRFGKSYNDTSVGIDNGQNEAWFSDDPDLLRRARDHLHPVRLHRLLALRQGRGDHRSRRHLRRRRGLHDVDDAR